MKILERIAQELNAPVEYRTNGINQPSNYIFSRLPDVRDIKRYPINSSLYCYVVEKLSKKLYLTAKDDEVLREAFGIVFSDAGIRARPLPMFSSIPSKYIYRETRLDIDGQNVCGLRSGDDSLFITRNGHRVSNAPEGAYDMLHYCASYGLTPQFTVVPNELLGTVIEVPGWHLVGIRSVLTGKILPMKYLSQIAGAFNLQPILLFNQDRDSFLKNSHYKGLVDLYITHDGEQFISRELTQYYQDILPVINFLRYGRDVRRFLCSLVTEVYHYCHLTEKEITVYNKSKEILEEMSERDYESIKSKIKRIRKFTMRKKH